MKKFLDPPYLGALWCRSYLSDKRKWRQPVVRSAPKVYYGYDRIPSENEHVFGGMVKLVDLNRAFPNQAKRPNLLYLVSSALPLFAVRMARFAKQAGAKLVVNQNGVAYPGWYGKGFEKINRPMAILNRLADHVIYQSQFCKTSAERYLQARNPKCDVLFNPVDTDVFRPPMQIENKSPQSPVLLLAGSHWSFYRPKVAMDVLKRVRRRYPETSLKIAGRYCWAEDPREAEKEVVAYAAQLSIGGYVSYVGPYTQKEAVGLLQQATVLIHTKYNDPCPRLVIEAMGCGTPIVFSETGGTVEIVGEKAGVGVPGPLDWEKDHPPDADRMADAVVEILENYECFSEGARKRAVQRFDLQDWLERHRLIFNKLLELS